MSPRHLYQSACRILSRPWAAVLAVFLLNLIMRLLLLGWNAACYTDSIYYMTALDRVRGTFILPGYPFAIRVFQVVFRDPTLAGRLVSMLAAAALVFPLYGLGRAIYGRRAAVLTLLLYTCSPLILRWSIRIYPHGLFSFFVVSAIYLFFLAGARERLLPAAAGVFVAGLAALVYPNGLALLPVCLGTVLVLLALRLRAEGRLKLWRRGWGAGVLIGSIPLVHAVLPAAYRQGAQRLLAFLPVALPGPEALWIALVLPGLWTVVWPLMVYAVPTQPIKLRAVLWKVADVLSLLLSISSWLFLHVWQEHLAQSHWYQQGMRTSWLSLTNRWDAWLGHYLLSFPHVLTYPVAIAALLGLVVTMIRARRKAVSWAWLSFYLYYLLTITFVLVVNKWWTPRYQYSLVPFTLLLAGAGLAYLTELRRLRWVGPVSIFLCLTVGIGFSLFTLHASRDSFGDVIRSAHYVRDHCAPDRRVYSDELLKTGFWAKRRIMGYNPRSSGQLRAGDLVLLHSWHHNLETESARLNRRFTTTIVHREPSTLIPILADDIVDWSGRRLNRRANDPVVWGQRFQRQHFESRLIELGELGTPDAEGGR